MPVIASMLLQTAFGIVDAFFVGMLGPLELAAISLSFPIVYIFIAIGTGLEIGTNALVSQAVGRKDLKKAGCFASNALFLAALLAVLVSIASIVIAPALFGLMSSDEKVVELAFQYSTPIFAGVIFTFAWFISDALLRAQGNSRTPMKNLAFAVVLNAILDPFLIFGIGPFPKLGLFGAAIVTVFADFVAAALNFAYIFSGSTMVKLELKNFRFDPGCIKHLVLVGLPVTVSSSISAIGFFLLTVIVGTFGSLAIAAYGIGMRINSISVLPVVGMESGVASFVGQNFGAKNFERAKKVAVFGTMLSLAFATAIAAVAILFPAQLAGIFTSDQTVIEFGKQYLLIVPLAYVLYGLYFSMQGAFEGIGKTWLVLATNIVYWATAVGVALLLSEQIGITGIWIAIVAAAALEAVAVIIIFYSGIWLKQSAKKAGGQDF